MMQHEENRRRARRYTMGVPVRVGDREGHTKDVSSKGLYFVAPNDMSVGSMMQLDLELPSASPAGPLSIRVQARIIRRDVIGDLLGVAAEIESWVIPEEAGLLKQVLG